MGLLVTGTEEKKITVKGTELELPSVYLRIEFAGYADGKTLEVAFKTYVNEAEFKKEDSTPIATSLVNNIGGNVRFELAPEEEQGLTLALAKLAEVFTSEGYTVSIV